MADNKIKCCNCGKDIEFLDADKSEYEGLDILCEDCYMLRDVFDTEERYEEEEK